MTVLRAAAAILTGLALAGGGLLAAAPATADQVWHQGIERPGPDAPCTAPADETPWQASFTGQRDWAPSWAQWANGGRGGWVCQRSIIWAVSARTPVAFCVQSSDIEWVDFLGAWALPVLSPVYNDPACSTGPGESLWDLVYAPAGWDPSALCLQAFGTDRDLRTFGYDVWGCREYA